MSEAEKQSYDESASATCVRRKTDLATGFVGEDDLEKNPRKGLKRSLEAIDAIVPFVGDAIAIVPYTKPPEDLMLWSASAAATPATFDDIREAARSCQLQLPQNANGLYQAISVKLAASFVNKKKRPSSLWSRTRIQVGQDTVRGCGRRQR